MVTQATATAFACSLLAPLAPNLLEWLRRRLTPLAFSSVGSAAVREA